MDEEYDPFAELPVEDFPKRAEWCMQNMNNRIYRLTDEKIEQYTSQELDAKILLEMVMAHNRAASVLMVYEKIVNGGPMPDSPEGLCREMKILLDEIYKELKYYQKVYEAAERDLEWRALNNE